MTVAQNERESASSFGKRFDFFNAISIALL
jgi:hypothetical protein